MTGTWAVYMCAFSACVLNNQCDFLASALHDFERSCRLLKAEVTS